jgi:hypothetical protein
MTGTPFGSEGRGPAHNHPPAPGETRYVLILALCCTLAIAAIIGIPWWLTT